MSADQGHVITRSGGMNPFVGLRCNHYAVILADPPWRFQVYSEATGSSRAASNHYAVMDLADIQSLPVANLAARDSALFLWTTAPFLQKAFAVIAAWDFKYSTNLVWTKDKLGTGYWCRSQHEHLLIGRRGNFRAPKPADRPSSVIQAPRREHSRKPDEVYSIIEQAYPELAKIELFARHARPGWTAWGDEAPSTTQNKQNGIATPIPAMEAVMKPTKHLLDLKFTQPDPAIAQQLRRTVPGMAHFAATGPVGEVCNGCSYLTEFVRHGKRGNRCTKFSELMQGQVGANVPKNTPACRYFLKRPS